MNRLLKYLLFLAGLLALLAIAGVATAQVDLSFTPADTTIEPGHTTRLSVMLDEPIYFRTIELTVTYDPTLLSTVIGEPGDLFSSSGFFIWDGFEESVPGRWHGYAIVMGATDSLSGPGELFAWEVAGLIEGTSPITVTEVKLYEPNADLIPGVTLDSTTLRVRVAASGVGDLPTPRIGLTLQPNPFNPRTRVGFDLPAGGLVRLAVYDARGRRVATLHEGPAAAGALSFDWDGRDSGGMAQPGGVYLFRLETGAGGGAHTSTTKGILLK